MFKIFDVSIIFLFEAILLSVKVETGINVIFNSGVACHLEEKRLSIGATFSPQGIANLKLAWINNQSRDFFLSVINKSHDFGKFSSKETKYILILLAVLHLLQKNMMVLPKYAKSYAKNNA